MGLKPSCALVRGLILQLGRRGFAFMGVCASGQVGMYIQCIRSSEITSARALATITHLLFVDRSAREWLRNFVAWDKFVNRVYILNRLFRAHFALVYPMYSFYCDVIILAFYSKILKLYLSNRNNQLAYHRLLIFFSIIYWSFINSNNISIKI